MFHKQSSKYYRIAEAVAEQCAGSGFGYPWRFTDRGSYVRAVTDWHLLNNDGYYMGKYGLKLIIPKKDPCSFRWYGKGHNKRIFVRYGLPDFFDQAFYDALEQV
jgi:hypothetical protein